MKNAHHSKFLSMAEFAARKQDPSHGELSYTSLQHNKVRMLAFTAVGSCALSIPADCLF
jgi:hypothetical protein